MPALALVFSSDGNALRVLRDALLEADLAADYCRDAASTIGNLSTEKYAAVIMDAPDVRERDGILRQLRCMPLNKDALAIVVLGTQTHAAKVFSLGANFLLYRPLSAERVRSSLRAAVRLIHRDKRRNRRATVHAAANLSCPAAESAAATLLDLSEEGLSLQCDQPLPPQSKIYLRFTLPGQTKSIQLSGEMMWQDSRRRMGIRFVDVPQSAQRLLKEWLDFKLSMPQSKVRIELPKSHGARLQQLASDRRTESRHTCRLSADVYEAGNRVPYRCTVTDISAGGFYVEMTAPLPIGTAVEVVVRTKELKFSWVGTVQKVDRGFGMGVAFATQTAVQRAQVQEVIKVAFRDREAEGDPILRF
ncbi:MAG TPA: PilZ domain-containing protein [Terriglobales bacterium]|nr:PilZ domain-containing protein [Terriglobales bacterium]